MAQVFEAKGIKLVFLSHLMRWPRRPALSSVGQCVGSALLALGKSRGMVLGSRKAQELRLGKNVDPYPHRRELMLLMYYEGLKTEWGHLYQ